MDKCAVKIFLDIQGLEIFASYLPSLKLLEVVLYKTGE